MVFDGQATGSPERIVHRVSENRCLLPGSIGSTGTLCNSKTSMARTRPCSNREPRRQRDLPRAEPLRREIEISSSRQLLQRVDDRREFTPRRMCARPFESAPAVGSAVRWRLRQTAIQSVSREFSSQVEFTASGTHQDFVWWNSQYVPVAVGAAERHVVPPSRLWRDGKERGLLLIRRPMKCPAGPRILRGGAREGPAPVCWLAWDRRRGPHCPRADRIARSQG